MPSKPSDAPSENGPFDDAQDGGVEATPLQPAQPHDAFFRAVFGVPAHAAAVLQAILPPSVAAHVDWPSLEPVHASMVSKELAQRHGDVRTLDATEHGRLWLSRLLGYIELVNPHVDRDTLIRFLASPLGREPEENMLTFDELLLDRWGDRILDAATLDELLA